MSVIKKYSELTSVRKKLCEQLPLEKPYGIFIEPSNICNFDCIQCVHSSKDYKSLGGPLMNMSMECYEKVITDLESWGGEPLKVIRLYLEGESLVNKNFLDMLKMAKSRVTVDRIELTTNASLLSDDIIDGLITNELDYIRISIYGLHGDEFQRVTNSKFTPEKIYENVKKLRERRDSLNKEKPFIYVKMIDTFSPENDEFIVTYKDIADEVCIEPPMNWSNTGEDFVEKLYEERSNKVHSIISENCIEKYVCPYPFHTLSIKSNGDVLVCCVDWLRDTKIGNVFDETLEEIWNGDKLFQLRCQHIERRKFENRSCANCEIPLRISEMDNLDTITKDIF